MNRAATHLILASTNLGKIREFREFFQHIPGIDLTSLLNYPHYHAPEEGVVSFKENAEKKALHAAQMLKQWVIADDSGLVVPALDGAPGVCSARYSGNEATDAENRQMLLMAMAEFEGIERHAYFECCLCLAEPAGIKKTVVGICEGFVSHQEEGSNGFGYDSVFIKHGYDKTFAALAESTKNRVSHRWKALEKMLPALETIATIS
ncbi:MAG: RdgB/HAM1 family non-canonical purine NTP pyrophosphatase [Chlamydiia bacterium]|nr:RdgB/HAM1 family non-canonical purine NTP pyrophosphatase [Chlamydiia bacterium]